MIFSSFTNLITEQWCFSINGVRYSIKVKLTAKGVAFSFVLQIFILLSLITRQLRVQVIHFHRSNSSSRPLATKHVKWKWTFVLMAALSDVIFHLQVQKRFYLTSLTIEIGMGKLFIGDRNKFFHMFQAGKRIKDYSMLDHSEWEGGKKENQQLSFRLSRNINPRICL